LTAGHFIKLGVQFAGFKFGFGCDLLPAFPPSGIRTGEDVLRRGFGLAKLLFLWLAFAA